MLSGIHVARTNKGIKSHYLWENVKSTGSVDQEKKMIAGLEAIAEGFRLLG